MRLPMKIYFWVLVLLNAAAALFCLLAAAEQFEEEGFAFEEPPYHALLLLTTLSNTVFFLASLFSSGLWNRRAEKLAGRGMVAVNIVHAAVVLVVVCLTLQFFSEMDAMAERINARLFKRDYNPSPFPYLLTVLAGLLFTVPSFIGLYLRPAAYTESEPLPESADEAG